MPEIKTKQNAEKSIKKIDRKAIMTTKLKNSAMNIKEKAEESYTQNENSGVEYAERKVENITNSVGYYGTRKANQLGKQNVEMTKENIIKGKEKIKEVGSKFKDIKNTKNITAKDKKEIKAVYKKMKTPSKNNIKTTKEG